MTADLSLPRFQAPAAVDELPPVLQAALLAGPPQAVEHFTADDRFALRRLVDEGFVAGAWQVHGPELRRRAPDLGIAPTALLDDGRFGFWAEAVLERVRRYATEPLSVEDETRATAVHEAARAVVAVLEGFEVRHVMARRLAGSDTGGYCWTGSAVSASDADAAMRQPKPAATLSAMGRPLVASLQYVVAGYLAERRHTGRSTDGGSSDRRDARALLGEALGLTADDAVVGRVLTQVIEPLTSEAVEKHWAWIERVAHALLWHTRITGDDVRRLRTE
jgi:hypothetical protein